MRAGGFLAVLLGSAVLVSAGCGRDLDDAKVATDATETSPATGKLNREQETALRKSRDLVKDGSASSVVVSLIEDVGDGGGPAVFSVYDRRVADRVGTENLLGAFQVMATITTGTQPALVRSRKSRGGELVVVRLLRPKGGDSRYSFLLRRDDGQWNIVYDSLLAQALRAYVISQRSSDPSKPSAEATKAAERAVADLSLASLGKSSSESSKPKPKPTPTPTPTPGN